MLKKILIFISIIHLTACGAGSGKGLDAQGLPIKENTGGNNGGQPIPPPNDPANGPTLASLQQNIFGAICTNCHTGSNAPRGLRLDSEENSYAFLVSRAADEVPNLMRVNPGNPDASYLIRKLEGTSGIVGSRMPLGGPYLTQEQINSVRDWIANGAPRTGTGTKRTKISNMLVEKSSSQITASLHFSRTLDVDSISEKNVAISYVPAHSQAPITVNNFSLLVLDQSLEIIIPNVNPDTQTINISVKSPNETPILDSQFKMIDGNGEDNKGDVYHYEHTFK